MAVEGCSQVLGRRSRRVLYVFWPSVVAAQWVIHALMSLYTGTFTSLECPAGVQRPVPFVEDFFYMVWNALPLALAASLRLAEKGVRRTMILGIDEQHSHEAASAVSSTMKSSERLILSWPFLTLAACVGFLGCYQQFAKVTSWKDTLESMYWWQACFSPAVFWTRLVALFINLACLTLFVPALFSLLVSFARLGRPEYWHLDLLHVDRCGGAARYGRAAIVFTLIPFIVSTCALLGYFDHRGAGLLHVAGDTALLLLATGFGALTFILPLRPIHRELKRSKDRACTSLFLTLRRLEPLAGVSSADEVDVTPAGIERLKQLLDARKTLSEVYRLYAGASTWPFNLAIGARVVGTIGGPLVILIIDQVLNYLQRVQ